MKKRKPDQLDIDASNAIKAGMTYGKYMGLVKPFAELKAKEESENKRVCLCCGKDLTYEHGGKKYCSPACYRRYYYDTKVAKPPVKKVCAICGSAFMGKGREKYCNKICSQIAHKRRMQEYQAHKAKAAAQ